MNISRVKANLAGRNSRPAHVVLSLVFMASLFVALLAAYLPNAYAIAATTNLVKNASFEKDSNGDGVPNNWNGSNLTPADKRVCNKSYVGSCSFRMIPDASQAELYQFIAVSGNADDQFTFSAWTLTKDIDLAAGGIAGYLQINLTGGGTSFQQFEIPAGTSPWTLRQVSVTASAGFDSIYVGLVSGATSGKVWFDKLKLVELP